MIALTFSACVLMLTATVIACKIVVKYHLPRWLDHYQELKKQNSYLIAENVKTMSENYSLKNKY